MIDEARIYRLILSDIVNDEYVTAEDFDSTFLAYNEIEKLEISYFLLEKGIKIKRSYSLVNEISPNSRQEDATVVVTKNQIPYFNQEKVKQQKKHNCKLKNVIPQKFVNNSNNKKMAALTNTQLSVLIFKGDIEAESEILIKNQNLVITEATRLNQLFGNSLEIEDLIQSGYIGLLNVVRREPLDSNTNCSQLFVRHIRKSILVEIAAGGFFISFPYENIKRYFEILQIYRNNRQLNYAR